MRTEEDRQEYANAMSEPGFVNTRATNPALIESAVGTEGYGASSAGPGGGSGKSSGRMAAAGAYLMDAFAGGSGSGPLDQDTAMLVDADGNRFAASSKKFKQPATKASMSGALHKGVTGQDPISENGAQLGAIRALEAQIANLEKQLRARKGA
jgi:hypothetical protein